MKHYGIEVEGKFYTEQLSSVPGWTIEDKGRLIYDSTSDGIYIGTDTEWKEIISFPSSTIMLFGNPSSPTGWSLVAGWNDNRILLGGPTSGLSNGTYDPTYSWSPSINASSHSHNSGTLSFYVGGTLNNSITGNNLIRFWQGSLGGNWYGSASPPTNFFDGIPAEKPSGYSTSNQSWTSNVWTWLRTLTSSGSGDTASDSHTHTSSSQYSPKYKIVIACEKD